MRNVLVTLNYMHKYIEHILNYLNYMQAYIGNIHFEPSGWVPFEHCSQKNAHVLKMNAFRQRQIIVIINPLGVDCF